MMITVGFDGMAIISTFTLSYWFCSVNRQETVVKTCHIKIGENTLYIKIKFDA